MDAFESIVGKILEIDGYWVRKSVKVKLNPQEKAALKNPSMPTPEIDLIAIRGNECVFFEVKSYLDSAGVRLSGVEGSSGYKILNDTAFQNMVVPKVLAEFKLPPTTKVVFGLAAGKIHKGDTPKVIEHFKKKPNYRLITPKEIADKLLSLGESVYVSDEVTMTVKILRNENRLNKYP